MNRERDSLKRRLMNSERELEALKSVGLGLKKTSRAGRTGLDTFKLQESSVVADDHPDKENQNQSLNWGSGMGGISYTFQ